MALSILQAGIDRRVQINTVDIDGKIKINAVSNDILKIQKVNGSTLYDAFAFSFNNVEKTRILKINNVDILAFINHKAVYNNVYNKTEVDLDLLLFNRCCPRSIRYHYRTS